MDLVKLTEEIIKTIVNDPDTVSVKAIDTDEENFILLEVLVPEEDMPRVIGKAGAVANSVRTIVQAAARKQNKKVKINIDSF